MVLQRASGLRGVNPVLSITTLQKHPYCEYQTEL